MPSSKIEVTSGYGWIPLLALAAILYFVFGFSFNTLIKYYITIIGVLILAFLAYYFWYSPSETTTAVVGDDL